MQRQSNCLESRVSEACLDITDDGAKVHFSGVEQQLKAGPVKLRVELFPVSLNAEVGEYFINIGGKAAYGEISGEVQVPKFTLGGKTYELNLGLAVRAGVSAGINYGYVVLPNKQSIHISKPAKINAAAEQQGEARLVKGSVSWGFLSPSFEVMITDQESRKSETIPSELITTKLHQETNPFLFKKNIENIFTDLISQKKIEMLSEDELQDLAKVEVEKLRNDSDVIESIEELETISKAEVLVEPIDEFSDADIREFQSMKQKKIKAGLNPDKATLESIESRFHLAKNIKLLHKKMNLIMRAVSDEDISQFENESHIKKTHDELTLLRKSNNNDLHYEEKIYEKEKELQHLKIEVMAKRLEFTKTLKETGYAVSGASNLLGIAGESELAHVVSVMGQSTLNIVENGAALLGHGLLAGSINPVMAFSNIAGAAFNIVTLFKPKAQTPDYFSLLLPYIKQIARDIEQLKLLTKDEFAAVKLQLYENHLVALEKFDALTDNQNDMLATLQTIYFEMRSSFAAQSDQLRHISRKLFDLQYTINSVPHREDIENIKKLLRFILENTNLDFNKLSNDLDHVGFENSISHQFENIFDLVDDAEPIAYFQLINYFNTLQNGNIPTKKLPNPMILLYAGIANLLLNLIQTPNPQAKFPTERILMRDIIRLKNYKTIFDEINQVFKDARDQPFLNNLIDAFEEATLNLAKAMDDRILKIEEQYTKEKQMQLDQEQAQYRQDLSNRFSAKLHINDNGWYKGTKTHIERWYRGRAWGGQRTDDTNYVHETLHSSYIRETEKRIVDQRHAAVKIIRDNVISSKQNHLSATKKSKISPFHGVGYLVAKEGRLPILLAPDPLLPPDHPHFPVLNKLKEAELFGRGFREFEYSITENNFIIDIYFNSVSAKKLKIVTIKLHDYNPRFYETQEAVWYYWMGGRVAVDKAGKITQWHQGCTPAQGYADQCTGHKGGEFDFHQWTITEPKEFINITAKADELYSLNVQLNVNQTNIDYINELVKGDYRDFQAHIQNELNNDLDYTSTHEVGTATRAFEESYRKLYGMLSFAYFDLMQDMQSELATWFTIQTVNTKRLKEKSSRSNLDELMNGLPSLKKIISKTNSLNPSFDLLSQVTNILEDFIEIYEPNAIEYNDRRPRKEKASEVADKLTDILVNIVYGLILTSPHAVSEDIIKKAISESQLSSLDEDTRLEIQQRIFVKLKQKSVHQLPGSAQSFTELGMVEELNQELEVDVRHQLSTSKIEDPDEDNKPRRKFETQNNGGFKPSPTLHSERRSPRDVNEIRKAAASLDLARKIDAYMERWKKSEECCGPDDASIALTIERELQEESASPMIDEDLFLQHQDMHRLFEAESDDPVNDNDLHYKTHPIEDSVANTASRNQPWFSFVLAGLPQISMVLKTVHQSNNQIVLAAPMQEFSNAGPGIGCDGPPRETITLDPITRKYIFDYSFTYQGEEIAGVMFYDHNGPCKSVEVVQDNILELRGLYSGLRIRPEDVCSALPPSLSDITLESAGQGARMGAMRGAANVIGGKNSWRATGIFYGGYYLYRFCDAYNQDANNDCWNAMCKAGTDVLWLAGSEVAVSQVSRGMKAAGDFLQEMKHTGVRLVGKVTSKLSNVVGYSIYAYEGVIAWQASPTPMRTVTQFATRVVSNVTSGYVAQQATEKVGAMICSVARFFGRSKQLSGGVDERTQTRSGLFR